MYEVGESPPIYPMGGSITSLSIDTDYMRTKRSWDGPVEDLTWGPSEEQASILVLDHSAA